MKFYRYEAVNYASMDETGDFVAPKFPNTVLELREFNMRKETPKGYWIGYGSWEEDERLRGTSKWVSKTSKRRFAHPTKEEALNYFIKRTEKRISIMQYQISSCRIALGLAKQLQNKNNEKQHI